MKSADMKKLLKQSYAKKIEDVGEWKVDPTLSGQRVQVYKHKDGKTAVVHRGTQGSEDLLTDARLLVGNTSGKRFKHAEKIQKEAKEKNTMIAKEKDIAIPT